MVRLEPTSREAFWQGFKTILPITVTNIPFALVTGIAGINTGLTPLEVTFMSAWVFAGAAQLVTLQLMATQTAMVLVLLAGLVVNLRYVMYSSALAKPLEAFTGWIKALAAFLMVDQNFVIAMQQYETQSSRYISWFFLGSGVPMWINWVIWTYIGALLGTKVPEQWGLDFAAPLCFLVLLVPALKDRPNMAAALVGGLVATICVDLPYRLGLFWGAISGVSVGVWLEHKETK
jgi:4-azaleucine resistance transporter AzlC